MEEDLVNKGLEDICADYSPGDLAVYLEGFHESEEEVAEHLAGCRLCRKELALQRSVSAAISSALLDVDAPALPPDFARKVAVAAESNVSRLRTGREIGIAGLIVVGILLLVSILAGGDDGSPALAFTGAGERIAAVGSVLGQLFLNLSLSVSVVLRSLTADVFSETGIWPAFVLAVGSFLFGLLRLRRTMQSRGA